MTKPHSAPRTHRAQWLLRLLAVVLSMVLLPARTHAAAISGIEFGQLNWFDHTGALHTPSSSWGRMAMDVSPDTTGIQYLNVVGDAGTGSSWIIKNYPLLPTVFGSPIRQSIEFNIVDLGLTSGTPLSSMGVVYSIDSAPRILQPAGAALGFGVTGIDYRATGGLLQNFVADVGEPAGHKAAGAATKVIQHKDVPDVQEGTDQCLPGSLARSIGWLNSEYNLGSTKTAQQIFDDLKALKIGAEFFDPKKNTYEDMIAAKAKYLDDLAGVHTKTKVLDLQNRVGPIPGVFEETGIDLVDWLYRELPTEDVELDYGHHIVTITGIFMQDGDTYVKYRDDIQGLDMTVTPEQTGKLTKVGGVYKFREMGGATDFTVQLAISESIPEPDSRVLVLLALAVAVAFVPSRRRVRR